MLTSTAFVIDVGNEPSIQETEIQVSQLEREQEGNDQWLDSNGMCFTFIL